MLNPDRYLTSPIKLPKGKKWAKDADVFKDKEYLFSTIYFYDADPDLYIHFRSHNGKRHQYLTIKNYACLTVHDVISDLYSAFNYRDTYPLGRHFEDGILKFWKKKDFFRWL